MKVNLKAKTVQVFVHNNNFSEEEIDTKKYLDSLEELCKSTDTEEAHKFADGILCNLLEELGYEEIVKSYHKIAKWYS